MSPEYVQYLKGEITLDEYRAARGLVPYQRSILRRVESKRSDDRYKARLRRLLKRINQTP